MKTKSHLIELCLGCGCANKFKLNVYYESIMSLIIKLPNYHIGPVVNSTVQLLLIFLFFLAGHVAVSHVNFSTTIFFGAAVSPHKLLTYVPAVTGKCRKDGPCQEFITQQYSASVSIYDASCASDLLFVIMQQKARRNC